MPSERATNYIRRFRSAAGQIWAFSGRRREGQASFPLCTQATDPTTSRRE